MPSGFGPDALPREVAPGSGGGGAASQGLLLYLRDEKAANTAGGTFTSGAWRTRTLNTEVVDEVGSTLSSNQFTLPAGTYEFRALAMAYIVAQNMLRLRNITDGTTTLTGTRSYAGGTAVSCTAHLRGRFTITATKTFELQHRCDLTNADDGFGFCTADFGNAEIYTSVWIKKVG